jgi:hypothetical protein
VLDRSVGADDPQGAVEPVAVRSSAGEEAAELLPLRSLVERVEDRQRVDAFAEVLSGLLAELLLARREVHHVVGELEGQAEALAVGAERLDVVLRGVGQQSAEPARRRDQRRGLAADHLEVVGFAPLQGPRGVDLADLPVAEDGDRVGEEPADVRPEIGGDLRRPREQVVAGEDRHRVIPALVRGRHAVARVGFVDHVVVVQRRDVRELDRDRPLDQPRVGRVPEVRGEQHEHRTEPLPTGLEQVARRRREQLGIGLDRLRERVLHVVETPADLRFEGGVGCLETGDHAAHPLTTSPPTPGRGSR